MAEGLRVELEGQRPAGTICVPPGSRAVTGVPPIVKLVKQSAPACSVVCTVTRITAPAPVG